MNFSQQVHSGEKIEDEPFVFANQVDQVFYTKDRTNPGWSFVTKVTPRDNFDMGEEWNDIESEPYHVSNLGDLFDTAHGNEMWTRRDIEGTTVDPIASSDPEALD